jgi:hypothetical protein
MAVFIKKQNLGSAPPPDRFRLREMPKGRTQKFGVMAEAIQKAQEVAAQKRDEQYEANADVQRWRGQLNDEQRGRDAIDRMIPTAQAVLEARTGKEATHEEGRKFAEEIAYKGDRQKGGE